MDTHIYIYLVYPYISTPPRNDPVIALGAEAGVKAPRARVGGAGADTYGVPEAGVVAGTGT